jgi:hypothetical protein
MAIKREEGKRGRKESKEKSINRNAGDIFELVT